MSALPQAEHQAASAPILEARGLTKHFPTGSMVWLGQHRPMVHAVDEVSLSLFPGHVTALVGESGSGKSTVARLLARLYRPTGGTILFRGTDVLKRRGPRNVLRYRAEVQMVFQDPFGSLNPVKTVAHHIERPLRIHKVVPSGQVDERVEHLLTTVGLNPAVEFAKKYPHQLSGGQRQRVAIARALAVEPQVLLADEPISMLDVSIRMGILNLILDLKERENISFLYITHDIASARYVADTVVVMYAGQVVESGPTDAVLQTPMHPYTRLLLSAVPNPEAGLRRQTFQGRGEAIQLVIDPPAACRFAPRCPQVEEGCTQRVPQLTEVAPGHWVRCCLYPGA
jgi:peptide/nickel transport system ATP-binding protein